ncbi:MAG: hypothetical protein NTU81_02960 [Candidatus Nomurabacteria bacterium]|nr:hypothetical protein [Candidatus Nomurabacteria bacterium]
MKASKIFKIFNSIFKPVANDLNLIQNDLSFLEKEMEEISKMKNRVEAIVRLFKVISPFHDKSGFSKIILKLEKKNYGQLNQTIHALKVLQKHFEESGRNPFGFNRTQTGEKVTPKKVFLGDIYGIHTKSASYWLKNQQKFEAENSGLSRKAKFGEGYISTWHCINDYQAGNFVLTHTKGILKQLSILKECSKKF